MKPLICTIAAGDAIDYGHITIPRMGEYAKRIGAAFQVIDEPFPNPVIDADTGEPGGPTYWKIPLIEWMGEQDKFHSMLYLDCDIFVKRSAGNIFQNFDHLSSLMMTPDMHSERELPEWKAWAAKHYGLGAPFLHEGKPEVYFNAGMFLMRPAAAYHMRLMRQQFPEIHSHWGDQGFLNCWAKFMEGRHLGVLSETWNVPYPYQTQDPNAGHFLHACGLAQQDKLPWFEKLEALGI